MFDADQYLEALEPPVFKYEGRVYLGRALSMEQWMRFAPQIQSAMKGDIDYVGYRVFIWQLCRAMFPRPWWKFWEKSVGQILLSLPLTAREAALKNFIESQGRAMGIKGFEPAPPAPTPGSN